MIISKDFHDNILNLKSLLKKDDEIFENFKAECASLGVPAEAITVELSNVFGRTFPQITIYVKTHELYKTLVLGGRPKTPEEDKLREDIIAIWKRICEEHSEFAPYYTNDIKLSPVLMHERYYDKFTRKHKEHIQQMVKSKFGPEPKYVFASSCGHLTIVYTEENYNKIANVEDVRNTVLNYTRDIVEKELETRDFPDLIINIYHTQMPNIDLYGLSRED